MSTTSAWEGAIDESLNRTKTEASDDSGSSMMDALQQIFSLAGLAKHELEAVSRQLAEDKAQLAQRSKLPGTVEIGDLQNALTEARLVVGKLNKQDQTYGGGLSKIQTKLQADLQTIEVNVERLVEHVSESKVAYEDVIKNQEDVITAFKKSELSQQNKDVKLLQRKLQEKDQELTQLSKKRETEVSALRKELAECKTRLSKLMGDKLSNKNPDIADLSDKNRPTKIAERFNELYDNQWTDAYEMAENLYKESSEKHITKLLIQLLMDVNRFCQKEFKQQEADLINALSRTSEVKTKASDDLLKQAKDYWRSTAEEVVDHLLQKYHPKEGRLQKLSTVVTGFTKECLKVCWLMVHQDPPLTFHLNVSEFEKFDGSLYKAYTKSGTLVDYVVWPALLLHEGGPTLAKGVVQCKDTVNSKQNQDAKYEASVQSEPEQFNPNVKQNTDSGKNKGERQLMSQSLRTKSDQLESQNRNVLSKTVIKTGITTQPGISDPLEEIFNPKNSAKDTTTSSSAAFESNLTRGNPSSLHGIAGSEMRGNNLPREAYQENMGYNVGNNIQTTQSTTKAYSNAQNQLHMPPNANDFSSCRPQTGTSSQHFSPQTSAFQYSSGGTNETSNTTYMQNNQGTNYQYQGHEHTIENSSRWQQTVPSPSQLQQTTYQISQNKSVGDQAQYQNTSTTHTLLHPQQQQDLICFEPAEPPQQHSLQTSHQSSPSQNVTRNSTGTTVASYSQASQQPGQTMVQQNTTWHGHQTNNQGYINAPISYPQSFTPTRKAMELFYQSNKLYGYNNPNARYWVDCVYGRNFYDICIYYDDLWNSHR